MILTNLRLVTEDEIVPGTIVFDETGITAVDPGRSALPGAVDGEGDYLAPGLVEMHTDNLEKHFMPRPQVFWPNGVAAAMAHDAQMAAAGVTTVYDAVCAGTNSGAKDYRRAIFGDMLDAIEMGQAEGLFRIDHRIHIRCELSGAELLDDVRPHAERPLVSLVSLMDHTPGQRQWRNLKDLERYHTGSGDKSVDEHRLEVAARMKLADNVPGNWEAIVAMFSARGIPIATHDDTEPDHVEAGLRSGARISEFPTTLAAARHAKASGMATVAGAPNVVRGGSHSSGVSASELAREGLLDGLSSDYVPSSLLQAVRHLAEEEALGLPRAMAMVTSNVADMVGLADRGRLRPGLRADLVRFRFSGRTPLVREVWSGGRRAF
ncbi:MAG: alpha-D-ribose 1-methylphosphonate 5-triphosphate diphosphatase [Alsobacter sp.]